MRHCWISRSRISMTSTVERNTADEISHTATDPAKAKEHGEDRKSEGHPLSNAKTERMRILKYTYVTIASRYTGNFELDALP